MDEFFVILCATDGREVSTPVPFVVRINHNVQADTSSGYPATAAIFSGALLLLIIFLALLIPLVTRAKRRYKAGKPLFKLGSHPSSADLKVKRKIQRDTSEPNWYGNNTYNYVEEVEVGKAEFTSTIKDIESQREGHSEVSSRKNSTAEMR
ncbi:hypothetical protein ACJMK2_007385 [Sinanodonta woodiana]|uniref:Uncharacterized protein n=1 Tax=Sinanodonta woodiana TaxID=1069815 RepID=A0ABD3VID1_SINWO